MKQEETREIDLDECVFRNYQPTSVKFCRGCDGGNYNCISYKSVKDYLKEWEKVEGVK